MFEINTFLNNRSLPSLIYRYVLRLFMLAKKIFTLKVPFNLYNHFTVFSSVNNSYNLRDRFITNNVKINNKFGKLTFKYFICSLINQHCFTEFSFTFSLFKQYLASHLDGIIKDEIKNNNKLFNLNLTKVTNYINYKNETKIIN